MNPDELSARIDAANDKMLVVEDTPQAAPLPRPVDMWQVYADARREYDRKSFPNGATKKYGIEAKKALQALSCAYDKAKANIDSALKRGDKMRARLWRQQYMEERMLKKIEAGENAADDYDYDILQKVYLRGQ